eukprot:jgi/Chlat1/8386/Chrsp80S07825
MPASAAAAAAVTASAQSYVAEAVRTLEAGLPSASPASANNLRAILFALQAADPAALLHDERLFEAVCVQLTSNEAGKTDCALCAWFFNWYQSPIPELRQYVLQFAPVLGCQYLERTSDHPADSFSGFEALLLGVYAQEMRLRGGHAVRYTIPSLAVPSAYHRPTAAQLADGSAGAESLVVEPPLKPLKGVRAGQRPLLVAIAVGQFIRLIAMMPKASLVRFCTCCTRVSTLGYTWASSVSKENAFAVSASAVTLQMQDAADHSQPSTKSPTLISSASLSAPLTPLPEASQHRVPLPLNLLQQFIIGLGYCLHQQAAADIAALALRALHQRVTYDLFTEGILLTRSLLAAHEDFVSRQAAGQ